MSKWKFKLGVQAKSKISGFKGTITCRSEHLNSCNRYWIAPKVDKDGKLPDGYWFDEGEIERVKTKKKPLKRTNQDNGGFPSHIK